MKLGNRRGSVIFEGVMVMGILMMAVIIHFELIRRIYFEVVFHHETFLEARSFALSGRTGGGASFLKSALPSVVSYGRLTSRPTADGVTSVRHYRYPAFLRFPYRGEMKHHFEVTAECRFPFS